ncbi:MAG: hypothetical protein IKM89_00415 [Bacteroidales bacterium]|nr:hypothetical protein [Bacteroidales bacterium]
MEAKRTALILGVFLLAGCQRAARPGEGGVEVVFSVVGEETRLTGTDGERTVDNWALLLYRDGRLAEAGTSDSGASIRKRLPEGGYTAFAVVNPPASFAPAGYPELSTLAAAESALRDNAPGRLVMAGSRTITVPVPDGATQHIGVDRLVCKAEIRKISVRFADPILAARRFVLKGIYLTNCYGKSRYDSDWDAAEIGSDASLWYNRMGYHPGSGADGILAETGLDATVTADTPHVQRHTFYYYPNPLPETLDSRSGNWDRRRTRLVLETEIGGRTYYYAVTLPASQRNRTYLIEEAIIRKLGSRDPEQDEPGAIDVLFRTTAEDWYPEYNVTENS